MQLEAYALTVTGRRRNNEDAICAQPELGLFVVADGMGGYEGGEVASALAVETIHSLIRRTASGGDVIWPYAIDPQCSLDENEVMVAARHAADQIAARRTGALRDMGSTLAMLRVAGDRAVIAHVGDSRVYRLRGRALTQLTIDHSLAAELEKSGAKPEANFPWRHVITRALGTATADPEVQSASIERGDVYLLCSDGLYEVLEPGQIAGLLCAPAEAACRALVEAAYAKGSHDNISAIVVRVR